MLCWKVSRLVLVRESIFVVSVDVWGCMFRSVYLYSGVKVM